MKQNNRIDITTLKNCVTALEESAAVFDANASDAGGRMKDTLRSGVIHNFETAYELCWKHMKRWLEANVDPNIVMNTTRRDFYRVAAESGLISNVKDWWDFHDARNRTSHTYKEAAAVDVFNSAVSFIAAAKSFIAAIERKI